MPRLDRLSELSRSTLLTYPAIVNESAPFTKPRKPLRSSRLALVTTAGLHLRGDRPFGGGDQSYRVFPSATPVQDIVQSHVSIGFDRTGILRDLNVVMPVDRVREMVEQSELGGVGPNFYSFMGTQRTYDTILHESGPDVARRLLDEGVDLVFLTGT